MSQPAPTSWGGSAHSCGGSVKHAMANQVRGLPPPWYQEFLVFLSYVAVSCSVSKMVVIEGAIQPPSWEIEASGVPCSVIHWQHIRFVVPAGTYVCVFVLQHIYRLLVMVHVYVCLVLQHMQCLLAMVHMYVCEYCVVFSCSGAF